ncbi:Ldh family oxidoreductase [Teichococcus oryzae]|uniref:Ldh family oxidoreductase n=1 Tax=Teichococcus oryzae TaxID=1608942 RepID=A0A5B2TAK6_9PROT|nr:Ldh family oxidoreductase [Pseudoroseomonas oryzae]KAA2211576.1 Ldh family oxidoreductase [Pseudoroseomonas oryzae]
MNRYASSDLRNFAAMLFAAEGLSAGHAAISADCLVAADLRGTHSHGVIRLPFLLQRLRQGGANPRPALRVLRDAPATALIDGDGGLGAVTAHEAMQMAIKKAAQCGVGLVVARNSDFIGTCAYSAMLALQCGMIGLTWTNGAPGMAPWGGRQNAIGNNPLGIAVPAAEQPPVVLDMAMSVSAGGKVRLAAKRGEDIPEGWILDREGRDTTAPEALADGGALLPLGHKGFGLAVMGEILAGILGDAAMLDEIPPWFAAPERRVASGHLHLAIDIAAFRDVAGFRLRVDDLTGRLKETPLRAGCEEILLPGERAARAEAQQSDHGIPLPTAIEADLHDLAGMHGLVPPRPLAQPASA